MMLWTILTAMACAAAVLLAIPLVRRYENRSTGSGADTVVYRDQLAEIERDRASGDISEEQYQLAKLEIQRRLLAAANAAVPAAPIGSGWKVAAVVASTGFVALASVNIYALYGSPEAVNGSQSAIAMPALVPAAAPSAGATGNVDDMIGKLAARLEKQPDDAEGWRMLGWSYFNTQRYGDAAGSYAKAMALAPDELSYKSSYAEALVQAAGGIVTPDARKVFDAVLAADAREERSRFYVALATEQAGQSAEALGLWLALLADAPPEAGWLADVKSHVADLGKSTGRDVSAALASAAAPAAATAQGGDQQAMIAGMVERLAQKLETSPKDAEGWKRLIRSRVVLKQQDLAKEALGKALAAFAGDEAARQDIASLARDLGVVSE